MDITVAKTPTTTFSQNIVKASPAQTLNTSKTQFNLVLSKQIAKAMMERAVRDDIVAQNTSSLDELRQLLNSV